MSPRHAVIRAAFVLLLAAVPAAGQPPNPPAPPYGQGPLPADSSMRLQVTPRETQVFVDGYYAGIVDNFDGAFQRLHLESGQHTLQLFLPGHRLHVQDLYLQPGNTLIVRHAMQSLDAGEPEPARPAGSDRVPHAAARGPVATPPVPGGPARPAAAAPGTPAGAYGTVRIHMQPGDAMVLIDGERWNGSTGDLEIQLAPGRHTIEVRKGGYRDYLTEITVRAGETTRLNIGLTAAT